MLKYVQASEASFTLTIAAFAVFAFLALGPNANSQTAVGNRAKSNFETNCVVCHGADGTGSALGKRLHAPNLHSKEVQSQSSAALAEIVSKGKGSMPPFGSALDAKEIHDLIRYIRQFRSAAPPAGAK